MTASPQRRRNRTIAAALSGVLVLVAAPLMGYLGWQVLKDSKAGTQVETLDEIAFPSTPTAMLAIVDDQNLVVSLAVMVMSPSPGEGQPAVGGTLISIPTSANRAQTSDEVAAPVADSLINSGEEGLLGDVEDLTRVTVNFDAVVNADALAALLAPIGDISVTLPNDVVTATAEGATETLYVAGTADLTPAEAAGVLLAREPGQAESRRLPNVRAVWTALATAVGPGIDSGTDLGNEIVDFNDFIAHFTAGPIQVFNDVNTTPVTGALNPDQLDVGNLDNTSMVLLMASLAPSAMITPNPTLNFRIENGLTQADVDAAGLVGMTPTDVTRDLVARLLFLSGNIVSVSSAVYTLDTEVAPDTTAMFTLDGNAPPALEAVSKLLGVLEYEPLPFKFELVDVVIVVGRTYLADIARVRDEAETGDTTDATTAESTAESTDADDATAGSINEVDVDTTATGEPPVSVADTVTS